MRGVEAGTGFPLTDIVPGENRRAAAVRNGIKQLDLPGPAGKGAVLHIRKAEVVHGIVGAGRPIDAVAWIGWRAAWSGGADHGEPAGTGRTGLGRRGVKGAGEAAGRKAERTMFGHARLDLMTQPVIQPVLFQIGAQLGVSAGVKADLVTVILQRVQAIDLPGCGRVNM